MGASKEMRAVYIDDGKIERRQLPIPALGEKEALVKVELSGICTTDLQLLRGYKSFRGVPGHEFVGQVVECDNKSFSGQRVVGEINLGCEDCSFCRIGLQRHCKNRKNFRYLGVARLSRGVSNNTSSQLISCPR